jgi:uncharacterized membrane protein YwzB
MIQRIQSVWLLASGLLGTLTFKFPFWQSDLKTGGVRSFITQKSPILICLAFPVLIALSIGTIFLFKNRSLQIRLCLLGMVMAIGILVLEAFIASNEKTLADYSDGSWGPGIVIPLLIVVALFLAIRGIRKDQKLVKSLDRLR